MSLSSRFWMWRRVALSSLVLPATTQLVMAQQSSVSGAAPACTDSVPASAFSIAMRTDTLYAVAELGYQAPDEAKLYAALLVDAFAKEFRPPNPFGFTAWRSPPAPAKGVAIPAISAEVMVVIRPNGKLQRIVFSQTSLVAAVDSALETTLRKAVESDVVARPSDLQIRKDLTLFFSITLDPKPGQIRPPGNVPPSRTKPLTPARRTVEQALLILQLPSAQFSSFLRANREDSKPPRFPRELVAAVREGDVTIEFVVGRDGRIVPGTARLLGATERAFALGVFQALDGLRFVPGEIGGCPVPVLAMQSFAFRMNRR